MALTATTTSQVLNGLSWNGPNSRFGTAGRITTVRSRNLVKVITSSEGRRSLNPSRAVLSSSKSIESTTTVTATQ